MLTIKTYDEGTSVRMEEGEKDKSKKTISDKPSFTQRILELKLLKIAVIPIDFLDTPDL